MMPPYATKWDEELEFVLVLMVIYEYKVILKLGKCSPNCSFSGKCCSILGNIFHFISFINQMTLALNMIMLIV